jgi:hypothetical protein
MLNTNYYMGLEIKIEQTMYKLSELSYKLSCPLFVQRDITIILFI